MNTNSPVDDKIPAEVLKFFLDLIQENLNASYTAINQMTVQIEELSQFLISKPSNQDVIERITNIVRTHDSKFDKKDKELLHLQNYKEYYNNVLNKVTELLTELKKSGAYHNDFEKNILEKIKSIKEAYDIILKTQHIEKESFQEIKKDVKKLNDNFQKLFWGVILVVTVIGSLWTVIEKLVIQSIK